MLIQSRLERRFTWTSRRRRRPVAGPGRHHGLPRRALMADVVLRSENLHKRYGELEVLRGVSFEVDRGQVKVIIGPSGSGKSTLAPLPRAARAAGRGRRLPREASASAALSEKELAPHRSEVGMVFQRFNLFQNMTALDNVMCGLRRGASPAEARGARAGARVPRPRRPGRQGVAVSRRALRRAAAARRDRAGARDAPEGDAVRRADVGARRRARARGARRDGVARARRDDDGRRHARAPLRAPRRAARC